MDFELRVTEAELGQILEALSDKPFRQVVVLINKLGEQAKAQVKPKAD